MLNGWGQFAAGSSSVNEALSLIAPMPEETGALAGLPAGGTGWTLRGRWPRLARCPCPFLSEWRTPGIARGGDGEFGRAESAGKGV